MAKKPLKDCRKAKDFDKFFGSHPDLVDTRQTGSHKIWRGPTGSVVTHSNGATDIPKGTRSSIRRMAALAGLFLFMGCSLIFIQLQAHGVPEG